MKSWDQRPIEIASLLNPAFCSSILQHCIWKYQKETKNGLPYPVSFLILPLTLHQDTRNLMPERISSKLLIWVQDHPEILVNFSERVKHLIPITKEAILFGANNSKIMISKNGELLTLNFIPKNNEEDDQEIKDCYRKAMTLGNWFSTAGTSTMIFSIFGVSP